MEQRCIKYYLCSVNISGIILFIFDDYFWVLVECTCLMLWVPDSMKVEGLLVSITKAMQRAFTLYTDKRDWYPSQSSGFNNTDLEREKENICQRVTWREKKNIFI